MNTLTAENFPLLRPLSRSINNKANYLCELHNDCAVSYDGYVLFSRYNKQVDSVPIKNEYKNLGDDLIEDKEALAKETIIINNLIKCCIKADNGDRVVKHYPFSNAPYALLPEELHKPLGLYQVSLYTNGKFTDEFILKFRKRHEDSINTIKLRILNNLLCDW